MKERIGSVIALVSLVLSCSLVCVGCQPPCGYFTLDWGAAPMQPRFCMYRDPDFQEPLGIRGITVWKMGRSSKDKNQWEFDLPWEIGQIAWRGGWEVDSLWEGGQTVWDLEYKVSDNFMKRLSTSPFPCLTYGKTPPGYQEKVKAEPLEPEEFYSVWIRGDGREVSKNMYFIIRLDATGTPDRLEYLQDSFLITPRNTTKSRDALKLY